MTNEELPFINHQKQISMKKIITILSFFLILLIGTALQGQVLIAKWTFPTGNPSDSLADGGLPVNLTKAIHTEGGTSVIDFSKNGATTKSAQATGWENGAMTKCWFVTVNTIGYKELKLSSKQQTGGNNPGPRDYMVQYRIDIAGTWIDVINSTLITANNWTSAVLDSIYLPEACNNQPLVFLRWIMTTNTNSSEGTVASTGINKIDDIYITGKLISTGVNSPEGNIHFTVSPNPSNGPVTITSPVIMKSIEIIDMSGKIVYSYKEVNKTAILLKSGFAPKGNYLVRIKMETGQTGIRQIVIF